MSTVTAGDAPARPYGGRIVGFRRSSAPTRLRAVKAPAATLYEDRLARVWTRALGALSVDERIAGDLLSTDWSSTNAAVAVMGQHAGAMTDVLVDVIVDAATPEVDALARGRTLAKKADDVAVKKLVAKIIFDMKDERAIAWAEAHAAQLVKAISDEVRAMIRAEVAKAVSEGTGVSPLARKLAGMVGLPPNWSAAPGKAYDRAFAAAEKGGASPAKAVAAGNKAAAATRTRLIKARALNIARTETATASNQGRYLGWQASAKAKLTNLSESKKRWITGPADWKGIKRCPVCASLSEVEVEVEEPFPNVGVVMPPAHPSCRCTAILVPPDVPPPLPPKAPTSDGSVPLGQTPPPAPAPGTGGWYENPDTGALEWLDGGPVTPPPKLYDGDTLIPGLDYPANAMTAEEAAAALVDDIVDDIQWGAAPTVDVPLGVPAGPPVPAWEAPKFPKEEWKLRPKADQPSLGGAHRKTVLVDDEGTEYLFKPVQGYLADAEVAASAMAREAGLDVPQVWRIQYGGEVGSIQPMVKNHRAAWPGGKASFDPTRLSDDDLRIIQRHRVFDWLIGNHDAHADQWVRSGKAYEGGKVVGIDKGQAFKHFGTDRLDFDYHPNGVYGESQPVYNLIEQAFADGRLTRQQFALIDEAAGEGGEVLDTLRALQALDDDVFRAMLRPYAEGRFNFDRAAIDGFLDDAVARKNRLGRDFTEYHKKLAAANKKATMPTPAPPSVLSGDGGPKGMAGAPASEADVDWMRVHDSPATSRSDYPAHIRWVGGDYRQLNAVLRSERGPAGYNSTDAAWLRKMDAETGTVKKDFIVERGTHWTMLDNTGLNPGDLQGSTILDEGFVASSAGGPAAFGGDIYLRIRMNAGSRGTYIRPVGLSSEREFLIGRGQHFFVHSAQRRGSTWYLDVEVVSEEWASANTRVFSSAKRRFITEADGSPVVKPKATRRTHISKPPPKKPPAGKSLSDGYWSSYVDGKWWTWVDY